MMRSFFLLFLFTLPLFLKAQQADSAKLIGIHPAVGKTITRDEKVKYKLFPQYKDDSFESAKIYKTSDSTFILSVKPVAGTELKHNITTVELDELFYRIDEKEKSKKAVEEDYVLSKEEREESQRNRSRSDNSDFWWDFLTQMTILTFETIIAIAFTN